MEKIFLVSILAEAMLAYLLGMAGGALIAEGTKKKKRKVRELYAPERYLDIESATLEDLGWFSSFLQASYQHYQYYRDYLKGGGLEVERIIEDLKKSRIVMPKRMEPEHSAIIQTMVAATHKFGGEKSMGLSAVLAMLAKSKLEKRKEEQYEYV
jgi:hypothetical protein